MKFLKRLLIPAITGLLTLSMFGANVANATPAFAKKEKKKCGYCHLAEAGGGKRGFRGKFYDKHAMSFKTFVEKTEAKKAGVKPGSSGAATKPTKPYTGA